MVAKKRLKTKIKTLNEIAHLKDSGFGRPWPRHGLKLLHWFANECIAFDKNNEMCVMCDPTKESFGFHCFENRCGEQGDKLLPNVNIPYYVVGNLNYNGAHELPSYVSEAYSHNPDDSNTERIIISLRNDKRIQRVYVTQHINNTNYDPVSTFRISRSLLMIIRKKNLEMFLTSLKLVSPQSITNITPDTSLSYVAGDTFAMTYEEQNDQEQLTTPAHSPTLQKTKTSTVAVDVSANLHPELYNNSDTQPPSNSKSTCTIIPMEDTQEDFLVMRTSCWGNCTIL